MSWPFERDERLDMVTNIEPQVTAERYPNLVQMRGFIMSAGRGDAAQSGGKAAAYLTEYAFGLDLVLDGLEAARERESSPS